MGLGTIVEVLSLKWFMGIASREGKVAQNAVDSGFRLTEIKKNSKLV